MTTTPTDFVALWGPALEAAGYEIRTTSHHLIHIQGLWFSRIDDATAYARGLLVAAAAERGWAVHHLGTAKYAWAMMYAGDIYAENFVRHSTYDTALREGVIALMAREASK